MSLCQTADSEASLGLLEQPEHLCVSICVYNWKPRGFCTCLSVCIAGGALGATGREEKASGKKVMEQKEITATWETIPWASCGSAGLESTVQRTAAAVR
jgi:hypothetical protein